MRSGTDTIATASNQISAGNLDLSLRTVQQASSLEETASSMEELAGTIKQNADSARQATQLALAASTVALKGGDVVSEVVQTLGSINDSAKKIVDIISVTDGIALQTNILALNAAVEAARAGKQGRACRRRQRGAQSGTVSGIITEIAAASQERTVGIEQINQAITRMDEVTQQNAALVEQAAAAAGALKDQAQGLLQAVSVFRIGAPAHAAPAKRRVQAGAVVSLASARPALAVGRSESAPAKRIANGARAGSDWVEF